ncbi:YutD family protein [Haloplasma contractile]|uniref:DUF1027 domain-containing protein n=1 Tax=Haloplasma contractile SSD-17B TaxID=1033810 RepID=U2DYP4_9MOLU|nr:YutD family protein [Haloplasma contractile]ERJ13367.1 hypothetical protein HLPCO_000018 [Haloplasma contractile SSD-17B]
MIEIGNKKFEIVKDYRDGFDEEVFTKKYTGTLDKYNVIVGDISSNLLRLKGFTTKGNKRSSKHVNAIPDYLNEACNYNCPYFIVKRVSD